MNVVPRTSQWGELIRPDRVHGSLYSDPAIFEAELQNIWYRTWVYVGHESEVAARTDVCTASATALAPRKAGTTVPRSR